MQEVQHRGALFIRVDCGEDQAAMVVNGDVDELGTDASYLVTTIAYDAMRGPRDVHQALDVYVQQIAEREVLAAHHHRRWLEITHPVQLRASEDAAHGGPAQACGATVASASTMNTAVLKTSNASLAVSPDPLCNSPISITLLHICSRLTHVSRAFSDNPSGLLSRRVFANSTSQFLIRWTTY